MYKENNFNAIHFVATIMVIAGHMGVLSGGHALSILGQPIHGLGVRIIFIISGYLISSSWMADPNLLRYAVKRMLRIWPPLVICVLLSIFVVGPVFTTLPLRDYFSSPMTWDYMENIIMKTQYNLPGVFANNPYPDAVNGSLWTLPIEILLYCWIPIIIIVVRRFSRNDIMKIAIAMFTCTFSIIQQKFFPDWRIKIAGIGISTTALILISYYTIGMAFTSPMMKKILSLPLAVLFVMLYSCFTFGGLMKDAMLFILLPYLIFSL